MTVRQSLLAILDQGPCYGYQLRAEFDRRTGSTWPLNVGQTYTTLERLERDGLVRRGDTDSDGHLYWEITDQGREDVAGWLGSPVEQPAGTRDELAIKLALAATLPGVDAIEVLGAQRRASLPVLDELTRTAAAGGEPAGPEDLARRLILEALVLDAEAEVRWLDRCEELLRHSEAGSLPLSTEKPRRGRPVSRTDPAASAR